MEQLIKNNVNDFYDQRNDTARSFNKSFFGGNNGNNDDDDPFEVKQQYDAKKKKTQYVSEPSHGLDYQ